MNFRKRPPLFPLPWPSPLPTRLLTAWLTSLLLTLPGTLGAQESPATDPVSQPEAAVADQAVAENQPAEETEVLRAVVRISWKLIDRLADDQIDADVPFDSPMMGGHMTGRVRSKADLTIELQEHEEHAHFTIHAKGTARGNFNARRDTIHISGPMTIPFNATKEVIFNGRQFVAGKPHVRANVNVQFQCISREGLFPNLGRRIVANAAERERPQVQRSAEPLAEEYLTKFVDEETETIVAQLNQVSDLEKSVLRVYPQLKDWQIQLSSSAEHLEARYAPPGSSPLKLPIDPRRPQNAGIEIWIRTTAAEAKLLERIGGWDQSQQLLKGYLEGQEVDVGNMASDAQIVAINDWVVVALGKAVDSAE